MEQAAKDANPSLRCPNDEAMLRPVQAMSPQGAVIMLDQCVCCGGIWFDKWELFQVEAGRVKEIAAVDLESLRCPAGKPIAEKSHCPRCGEKLDSFKDPHIPANIQMLICHGCEGFWLNHGEAAGYADFRQSRLQERSERLAGEYEKMLQSHSNKDYWQAVEQFGNHMGRQRDVLTGLPLDGSAAQLARIDAAQDAFYAILGTVARLLFGWL